ncbi:MAG TPA: phosphoribosylglycinamide formyltransferase [Ruminococcaceae bacterium]|nr:phosphoribosylglycinamide formyltransferase [Oscillospiraceae bacterium]
MLSLNKKTTIAVLVSGGGTNLQALIDAEKNGILKSGEIRLVVSGNKDAYALKRAEAAGIATAVCERKSMTADQFEKAILDALHKANAELIVLAGFMNILSADFVKHYPNRIINVHPSLIPSFCGAGFFGLRVHKAALDYGVKVTGATVHLVNEIPDGGKIILQKAVSVEENDTPETLQKRVMQNAEWEILPKAAEIVCKQIKESQNERV